MPTYEASPTFLREHGKLTHAQRAAFVSVLPDFIEDLKKREENPAAPFRPALRVKRYRSVEGVFEMTWNADGRALFRYGPEHLAGKLHIQWIRIGTHEIL